MKLKKILNSNFFFYFAYLAAAAGICAAIFAYNRFHEKEKISIYLQEQVENSQTLFMAAQKAYNLLSHLTFEEIIDKPPVVSLLEQALKSDEKRRAEIRRRLYAMLKESYLSLLRFNLYQLHFHLPGAISFLRFHCPERFGDNLWNIRHGVVQVNLTREPVSCFEIGRVREGFRNVFPIIKNEHLIATVEISYSVQAIKDYVEAISPTTVLFLYPAKIAERYMWPDILEKNFRKSAISQDYYVARSFFESEAGRIIAPDEIYGFNKSLGSKPEVQESLRRHKTFSSFFTQNGEDYLATFLSIENVKGEHSGYIVFFRRDSFRESIERSFWQRTLLGSTFSIFFIMLLGYYHRLQLQSKRQLEYLASTDLLTGIYNRRQLLILLEQAIRLARRNRQPLSLLFFDIDHFKQINDRYGHDIGDIILKEVADLVKNAIRQSDIFGRWGGEEFIVVLHDCPLSKAMNKADLLRQLISDYEFPNGIKITCSFGVASLKEDEDAAALIRRADEALYRAKQRGRNRVEEAGLF